MGHMLLIRRNTLVIQMALWLSVVFIGTGLAQRAFAQDDGEAALRERIELVRNLSPDDQQRLRAALERFRSLPAEKQTELRRRAREVGPERLRELVGRDVERLRERHRALQSERQEILRALGGAARFDDLSSDEKEYLKSVALRRFQIHVRRAILNAGGPDAMEDFNRRPPDERRAMMQTRLEQIQADLLAEESPESQAAFAAAGPREQKAMRRRFLAEYRLRLVPSFAAGFNAQVVQPFLSAEPDVRHDEAQRWIGRARWFEMTKRLDKELGVSRTALRQLSSLGPEQWGRVRDIYVRTEGQTPTERRLEIERAIQELYGQIAAEQTDGTRGGKDGLRRLLRESGEHRRDGRRKRRGEPR